MHIAKNDGNPENRLEIRRNHGMASTSKGRREGSLQGFTSWARMTELAKPGDLLEIQRHLFTHFTLYLGDGKVMNIKAVESYTWAEICEESLEEACWNDLVRISNRDHDDVAKSYFSVTPRSPPEIVRAARDLENQTVPFELSFRNCEYYSTLWRYGIGFSTQLTFLKPSRCNAYTFLYFVLKFMGAHEIFDSSALRFVTATYQYFMASRYCRTPSEIQISRYVSK